MPVGELKILCLSAEMGMRIVCSIMKHMVQITDVYGSIRPTKMSIPILVLLKPFWNFVRFTFMTKTGLSISVNILIFVKYEQHERAKVTLKIFNEWLEILFYYLVNFFSVPECYYENMCSPIPPFPHRL